MTDVVIFGGTTEGRQLAKYCEENGIAALVSVVSGYGRQMLADMSHLHVRAGALDEAQMYALLETEKPLLVLDATHPYAALVTASLRRVCEQLDIPYLRVLREHLEYGITAHEDAHSGFCVISAADMTEAVAVLGQDDRPVLVTTGSRELHAFTTLPGYEARIYARILPDSKGILACEEMGITGKHILAAQGPFSADMNQAMIRHVNAGWLVTKESGDRGGFMEKLDAAMACNIAVVVVGRPGEEEGISLEEAKERLAGFARPKQRNLCLIGTGMGGTGQLTLEAVEAISCCDAVLGAPRMLADMEEWTTDKVCAPLYLGTEVADWITAHPHHRSIAVLYSGDTGFYSGSRSLLKQLKKQVTADTWNVVVYPGISAVSCLCARLKISWDNLYLGSLHGRDEDVAELIKTHKRLFLLLGGEHTLKTVCESLIQAGYENVRIAAGERLGYPDERVWSGTAGSLKDESADSLTAVIITMGKEE